MSFSFCELAVAYLQNLLMMFPLISDHPLRERIQLVECNLKHIAIEDNDQFWPAHKTQICFSLNRYCLLECNLKQNAIEVDEQSLDILDTPSILTRAKDTDLLVLFVQKNVQDLKALCQIWSKHASMFLVNQ